MLKKRSSVLAKVKEKYRKTQKYKFGVHVMVDVSEAKNLDN